MVCVIHYAPEIFDRAKKHPIENWPFIILYSSKKFLPSPQINSEKSISPPSAPDPTSQSRIEVFMSPEKDGLPYPSRVWLRDCPRSTVTKVLAHIFSFISMKENENMEGGNIVVRFLCRLRYFDQIFMRILK